MTILSRLAAWWRRPALLPAGSNPPPFDEFGLPLVKPPPPPGPPPSRHFPPRPDGAQVPPPRRQVSHESAGDAGPRRSWNYRVIEFVDEIGEPWRAIHEVHYSEQGQPISYGENPASVVSSDGGGNEAALGWVLDRMREALGKPVLVERDFQRGSPQ